MHDQATYYVTTAIPYVNAKPHLGHVLEWFQADAIAKYHQSLGKRIFIASGADENSLKNVQAAEKVNVPIQDWLDEYAKIFQNAYASFGITLNAFRRGSDQKNHWPGVQKLWKLCEENGDIYTKKYSGLYCVGCESFYTPEELSDGKCPEHLTEPEVVSETNYFFRLSRYAAQIRELIQTDTVFITSEQFKNEMLGFIDQGLEDFSVSRSSERARGIGVPVPSDASQVMYVWFDALCVYLTAAGWGVDDAHFASLWPAAVHVIGKGINRFHSVYWIGMLLSAGLPLPKAISVHGYITAQGQKMSKSLGNVIDPYELQDAFPTEHIRYFLLKEIPTHADGDFTIEKFKEVYTADLANGVGNICSRVAKLAEKSEANFPVKEVAYDPEFVKLMNHFELSTAANWVMKYVRETDLFLSIKQPWKLTGDEQKIVLEDAIERVRVIGFHLQPFMPTTAQKIIEHFSNAKIKSISPLFPRYT